MSDWLLETGVYLLGVAVVPLVGVLLLCWGLWGDRSKGRARCPKCWYDMRGSLPSLVCPECGHAPGSEHQLYRSRRRWARVVVGVGLVVLFSYPVTIAGGWYREQLSIQALTQRGHKIDATVRIGPDWLVDRLPEGMVRLFERVESVQVLETGTDADLAECGKLWWLKRLELAGTQVTDAGLQHLKGSSQLEFLTLYADHMQVSEAGIVDLAEALPDLNVSLMVHEPFRFPSPER